MASFRRLKGFRGVCVVGLEGCGVIGGLRLRIYDRGSKYVSLVREGFDLIFCKMNEVV